MSEAALHSTRALYGIVALGVVNHTVLAGSRVAVSLDALALGATPWTVGILLALYAFLPMLLAVAAGRLSDRIGARRPMIAGTFAIAAGAALPFAFSGLGSLFFCATFVGAGFMVFQVAAQNATGELGGPTERAKNFSVLALGYSVSGFIGPLVAGFAIDHGGFPATFALFATLSLAPFAVLVGGRLPLPGPHLAGSGIHHGGVRTLLRHRTLRRVFAINALLAVGWDLHTIFVPVYGAQIGLSASAIGAVLSAFAAATFVVRFAMPAIARRVDEQRVLTGALLIAGVAYFAFPLAQSAATLMALSFFLGLGLGSGQPTVMALLHTHAPPGRMGEAAGVRMSLVQSIAVAVPLIFGALGVSIGLAPVLWSVGACLTTGGILSRRRRAA